MGNRLVVIVLAMFLVMGVVSISGCTDSSSNDGTSDSSLNVSNVQVISKGYGSYDIKATIIPDKDYSYLEMVAKWYDSSGAVIETSPLVWNMNNVKAGETIKATGLEYISGDETPAKVDILIFDSVFSGGDESNAIFKQTVEI
ncbi:MAG: hypothetical protein QME14_04625 [Methanobacteriaceae archaeon]|nr:hypothetical protein [Methanobacteriaceae archaeon]